MMRWYGEDFSGDLPLLVRDRTIITAVTDDEINDRDAVEICIEAASFQCLTCMCMIVDY